MDNLEHQKEIFKLWFAAITELVGLGILIMLVWHPVPKINEPIANIALGFITATVIGTPIAYILGGNPATKKPDTAPQIVQTGDQPLATTSNSSVGDGKSISIDQSKDLGVQTFTTDDKQ
jgi:hypothetical protein